MSVHFFLTTSLKLYISHSSIGIRLVIIECNGHKLAYIIIAFLNYRKVRLGYLKN